jgi:hypothetical protein
MTRILIAYCIFVTTSVQVTECVAQNELKLSRYQHLRDRSCYVDAPNVDAERSVLMIFQIFSPTFAADP